MFHLQYLFQLFEWRACKLAGLSQGSTEAKQADGTKIINLHFYLHLQS